MPMCCGMGRSYRGAAVTGRAQCAPSPGGCMPQHSIRAARLSGCLIAAFGCTALAGVALVYPPAPRGNVVDDYHGTAVADPYRWLEELDSPATRGWVEAEAKLTQGYLSATALRTKLRQRLAALYDFAAFGTPFVAGGRYFYTLNSGRQDQAVLYVTADAR